MSFPCPARGAPVARSPERWLLRCPACHAMLRARAIEDAPGRAYEVEAAGRPETRRRVELAWTPADERRLRRWLLWSSVITLGLVAVLFALARLL